MRIVARMKIIPGRMAQFKDMVAQLIRITKEQDSATDIYHFFIDEESGRVLIHEHYPHVDGFLEHMNNIAPVVGALLDVAEIEGVEVGGSVPPHVAMILKGFTGESDVAKPVRCLFYDHFATI